MFPGACSLRSAQCAALIALATVAGISRFEPSSPSEAANPNSGPSFSQATAASSSSSHRLSVLAHLIRLYRERFTLSSRYLSSAADDLAAHGSLLAPLAFPAASAADQPHLAEFPAAAFGFSRPINDASDAVRCHRFPFAVGPPAPTATSPQRADSTSVLRDVSARWPFVPPDIPFRLVSVARLACREFSGPTLDAANFPPSSALRGEPARLPASPSFRPPLGVSRSGGPGHFSFQHEHDRNLLA
jgi:hypothetical protein